MNSFASELANRVKKNQDRLQVLYGRESVHWDLSAKCTTERLKVFDYKSPCGYSIHLQQQAAKNTETGGAVWTAGVQLARYLEQRFATTASKMKCLELGSGTGIVGLAFACLGGDMTLTDLPKVIKHSTAKNVAANIEAVRKGGGNVHVCEFSWGDTTRETQLALLGGLDSTNSVNISSAIDSKKITYAVEQTRVPFDLIVASDVIYSKQTAKLLFSTVLYLLQSRELTGTPGAAELILSFDNRGRTGLRWFLDKILQAKHLLLVRSVPENDMKKGWVCKHISVYSVRLV